MPIDSVAYTTFVKEWTPRIKTAIGRFGFSGDEAEDILQTLLTEFCAGDYLNLYDAEKGAMSTFVYGFVNIRLKGYLRQHNTKFRKEQALVQPAFTDGWRRDSSP